MVRAAADGSPPRTGAEKPAARLTEKDITVKWTRTLGTVASLVAVAALTSTSVASATPSSGTSPTAPVIGSLDQQQKAKQDGIELKTKGEVSVLDFELTYQPGGYSGWHEHPGIVIATVKSGTVSRRTGCTTETFKAGQSFTEVGPHYVSNSGSIPAVLSITQIVPASELDARRIDLPAPRC
jgi:quercetin dioxygenase-like cupin family protein